MSVNTDDHSITSTVVSRHDRGTTPYGRAELRIEEMIAYRTAFSRIEDYIASVPGVTEDERAALWMFAWAKGNGWRERYRIMFDSV